MKQVVVIGGGISGLAAAHFARKTANVTLIERSNRLGGCIETRRNDDFVLEMGADSLATEKPAATQLACSLGLELQPIHDEYRGTCILRNGRLVRMPDEFRLFTPTSLRALVTSGLFSPAGILRAALEPFVPPRRDTADESLASFVTRRFGREVLERLAQPLLGGIYSGDPATLSVAATMPQLHDIERKYGSLVRGMRAIIKQTPPGARLVSIRGGLGMLVSALERELHDRIRTGVGVTQLQRRGRGWELTLSDGTRTFADAVICALPAHAAAELLQSVEPRLASRLLAINYNSIATVTMAYKLGEVPPLPNSTGFVVPSIEHRPLMATTFSSRKYADRAPFGYMTLRAFIGGRNGQAQVSSDDKSLGALVKREFRDILGITAEPAFVAVRRFLGALPEYSVGHREDVDRIEHLAQSLGNFALAGSAYRGVGIADCIRSGELAVRSLHHEDTHARAAIVR